MHQDKLRNFKLFKVIQLILLILFGLMFFIYICFDPQLKNNVYSNRNLLTICVFLWAFMLYSLVCIVADFSQLEKQIIESHTLKQTAYLDPLTGLANRNSCDMIFAKYLSYDDISDFGCILLSLTNIEEINSESGRLLGDKYLRDFAGILESFNDKYGFVGRNNGNEFLLIIEKCDELLLDSFNKELTEALEKYNDKVISPRLNVSVNYVLNSQAKISGFLELISTLYSQVK